jgi:AcrR family transcriptional regulator
VRVKTEEKRDAILEAAKGVFLERGYGGASMAEVAARAGGSKQTLYSYFSSKEQLFVAVMLERGAPLFDALLASFRDSPDLPSALREFAVAFLRLACTEEFLSFRRIVNAEGAKSNVGALFYEHGPRRFGESLAERMQQAMDEGRMRRAEPTRAAVHLQALCEAGPYQRLLEGALRTVADEELVQAAEAAVEVFIRAYEVR